MLQKIVNAHEWDFAQIQLNYLDWELYRSREQYEILTKAGIPVIVMEPLRGGARQTLTQDDLPGDCLPLTGPDAKYTVAADLQGEDGAVYHAQYVFIFRKEAS